MILSGFGGIATFALANMLPSSFIADTVSSMGALYGILLFTTGIFAIASALANDLLNAPNGAVLKSRWIVFLPAIIGVVGVCHGYLSMAPYRSVLPEDIAFPHNTIWATMTVGALLTLAATAIMFARQRSSDEPTLLPR
ncbi:hypothetical protein [Rhodopirellula bahusiensis]|uniref:hypothetical protein n=1 Tax=Rhodopirellula bahusiensis TaxID=2014065 RepID=UPI0013043C48|nr:hypothetical protein [Rhodopirellula bahusiensis]